MPGCCDCDGVPCRGNGVPGCGGVPCRGNGVPGCGDCDGMPGCGGVMGCGGCNVARLNGDRNCFRCADTQCREGVVWTSW